MLVWICGAPILMRLASDPIEIWKTIRDFLLNKDVPIKDVMFLEDNYVDIYINRLQDMNNFPNPKKYPSLGEDVRTVVQSMVAGGLLKLLGL